MKPLRKLFIHNRGEIAVRIARTCRRLGIRTAVAHSDVDANAMHVRVADERYPIAGKLVADTYLNIPLVCDAIRKSGADAVHPGYGLLSENPAFARAVQDMGLLFVGPDPLALERFGDKIGARRLARELALPTCPGTDAAVDADSAQRLARVIGFPLLVKAAAGGGGIGMLKVESEEEVVEAIRTCAGRSLSAFGDGRVYLERLLDRPRHVELQVVVLPNGEVHVLGERECSVQRRHQKILEEAPSSFTSLTAQLRKQMQQHAQAMMSAHPYRGLATVEFLLDAAADEPVPYFMEVNARLQVEHPITEMLTGLDLVALQLEVASGGNPTLEFSATAQHAFEARLCAEDPARGFIPQPGHVSSLRFPEAQGVRVDTSYEAGDDISTYFDPLIAKICVSGSDRRAALAALRQALADTAIVIQGKKKVQATNLPLLKRIAESSEFESGQYDTGLVSSIVQEASAGG